MNKSILASAICIAIATSAIPPAFALPAASTSGAQSAQNAALSPAATQLSQELVAAANSSTKALEERLASLQGEKDLENLEAAAKHIRENRLVNADNMALIDSRLDTLWLAQTDVKGSKLFGSQSSGARLSTAAQVGIIGGAIGLAAAAAAGGGGGGGSSSSAPTVPVDNVVEEPSEEIPIEEPVQPEDVGQAPTDGITPPSPGTISKPTVDEYIFTGGMEITGVIEAHARGFTGAGAVVAILDSGFYADHLELQGQFSGFYNAFTTSEAKDDAADFNGHGTHVAGIVGARANNFMGVGYAPDASLLGVRIGDATGALTTTSQQTADAFRWARDNGAHFINNSWGANLLASNVTKSQLESWLSPEIQEFRAGANADVIYVWSAGNTGGDQPQVYAALPQFFPELESNWVAVVNVDSVNGGGLHASSQKCGDAAAWCIAAPGFDIWAPYIGGEDVFAKLTGTSMAAPAVTGGLAVLKSAFPMLSNEQIVARLFITADKTGEYSNKDIYGHGLMDLDTATAPLGILSFVNGSGESSPVMLSTLKLGSAFGSTNPLAGISTMTIDSQGAGFATDLGGAVTVQKYRYDHADAATRLGTQAPREVATGNGTSLTYSYNATDGSTVENMVMGFADNSGMSTRFGFVSNPDVLSGGLSFTGISQQKLSFAAPYWMSENDTRAMGFQQGVDMLGGQLALTGFGADQRQGFALGYSANRAGSYQPTFELGLVNGEDSLFGTESGGALGFGDKSRTRFMGVRGQYNVSGITLFHNAYLGQSDIATSGLIAAIDNVVTSSWAFGGKMDQGNKQFGMLVAQPLRVESADATLSYVSGYANGAYTLSSTNVALAPTGRQINTEMFFATSLRTIEDVKLSLMRLDQPGHNAAAKADHLVTLSLGTRF